MEQPNNSLMCYICDMADKKSFDKEIDIADFTDGERCHIRLTSDNIYAKSIGLEETYTLRSVDEVDVFDDTDAFAKEKLEAEKSAKSKKNWGAGLVIIGLLSLLGGLVLIGVGAEAAGAAVGTLVFGTILLIWGSILRSKSKEALAKIKLKSYIKIVISGSNKLYLFDKNAEDSQKVAEFLEKVEETLTEYFKTFLRRFADD